MDLASKIQGCVVATVGVVGSEDGIRIGAQLLTAEVAAELYSHLWRYHKSFGHMTCDGIAHWLSRHETAPCTECGARPKLMVCGDCTARLWRLPCEHGRDGKPADGSGYLCDCIDCEEARADALYAAHELNEALPDGMHACAQGHDVLVHDDTAAEPVSPAMARKLARDIYAHEGTVTRERAWELLTC